MQSTIFGISTKLTNFDGMLTRFDYDEIFKKLLIDLLHKQY